MINHAIERGQARERREAGQQRAARGAAVRGIGGRRRGDGSGGAVAHPVRAGGAETAASGRRRAKIAATVERLQGELRKAAGQRHGPAASELRNLSLILEDWRFRAGLAEGCGAPAPLKALSALARSYARVAFTVPASDRDGAEIIRDRAAEIEDLCVFVYAASQRGRPLVRSGTVVVAERLRPFAAIHAIASGAVGFVVEGDVPEDGAAATLVRAAGLPSSGR